VASAICILLRKPTQKLNDENEQSHATHRAKEETECCFEELKLQPQGEKGWTLRDVNQCSDEGLGKIAVNSAKDHGDQTI
jgi:hypothetical protein